MGVRSVLMNLHIVIPDLIGADDENLSKCIKASENQWTDKFNIETMVERGNSYPDIFNRALTKIKSGYVLFIFPWIILKDKAFDNIDISKSNEKNSDLYVLSYESIEWNTTSLHKFGDRAVKCADYVCALHDHNGDIGYISIWNKILSVDLVHQQDIHFNDSLKEFWEYDFLLNYLRLCENIRFSDSMMAAFYSQPAPILSACERILEKRQLFNIYEILLREKVNDKKAKEIIDIEKEEYIVYEKSRLFMELEEASGENKLLREIKSEISDIGPKKEIKIFYKTVKAALGFRRRKLIAGFNTDRRIRKAKKLKEKETYYKNNFYKFRRPMRFIHGHVTRNKYILLYCESNTMKPHIMDYYRCVREMDGIKLFIFYPDLWNFEVPDGVELIKSRFKALFMPWDLVVCADAIAPLYYNREYEKLIYINHGLHMISYDKGKNLYAYEEGLGLFSAMFEPNKRYAAVMTVEYPNENICHTGYKNARDIIELGNKKSEYRKELGVKDEEKLIAVFGTWGIDSLFHRVGDALIDQAREMMKNGYKFILSIHPKEYSIYDENIKPLGDYIESLAEEGFIIRNPKDPSTKFMVAADMVVCDYSTLCEEAMLAGKPVLLSDFQTDRVWKNSTIAKYKERCPSFTRNSDLRMMIENVFADSELNEYAKQLAIDLLPPKGGYENAVREITQKVING